MPFSAPDFLPQLCRERTLHFAAACAPAWLPAIERHVRYIEATLARNIHTRHKHKLLQHPPNAPLTPGFLLPYLDCVLHFHCATDELITKLQAHDEHIWQQLREDLQRAAMQALSHPYSSEVARLFADECAQQTCEKILHAPYPCDVSFEAWSRLILINEMRQLWRRPENHQPSLDDERTRSWHELLADLAQAEGTRQAELRQTLMSAIARLNPPYRDLITATYFEELADVELAERLGRTVSAVRSMRQRALQNLRKILGAPH